MTDVQFQSYIKENTYGKKNFEHIDEQMKTIYQIHSKLLNTNIIGGKNLTQRHV